MRKFLQVVYYITGIFQRIFWLIEKTLLRY